MALDKLTKIDGGGISTTSNYRVGIITASKFIGPIEGTITATNGTFSGNVTIGGTLTYEDVTNIDSVGIITARDGIHVGAGVSVVGVSTFTNELQIAPSNSSSYVTHLNFNNTGTNFISHANSGATHFRNSTSGQTAVIVQGSNNAVDINSTLRHLGDTDTLMEFGDNTISFDTAGEQHLRIASDGNIGIGTNNNNPTSKLHILVDGVGQGIHIANKENLYPAASTGYSDIRFSFRDYLSGGSSSAPAIIRAQSHSAGATSRSSKLIFFTSSSDGTNDPIEKMRIEHNGRVGIGTNNPNAQLDVYKSGTATVVDTIITRTSGGGAFAVQCSDVAAANPVWALRTYSSEDLVFSPGGHANANEKVRIKADTGYFGIGTNDPDSILHLQDSNHGAITLQGGTTTSDLSLDFQTVAGVTTARIFSASDQGDLRFYTANTENLRILADGAVRIPTGSNSTNRLLIGDGAGALYVYHDGNTKFENATGYLKLQSNNNLYVDGAQLFFRNSGGTNRWKIDSSGHFLPGAVGSYNIGSASAEIGDVYIADDKRFYAGSDQNISLFHTSSNGINHLIGHPGNMFYHSGTHYFTNSATSQVYAQFIQNSYCELRYSGNLKFRTSETGIDVTGEVAATQDYPNFRPTIDFNFIVTKKLDPRITYERTGPASFTDEFGKVVLVGDNTPRFDHDPTTRESKGLLVEQSRTNYVKNSLGLGSGWVAGAGGFAFDDTITNPDGSLGAYHHTGAELYHQNIDLSGANTNTIIVSLWVKERSGQSGSLHIEIYQQITGSVIGLGAFSFNPATEVVSTSDANFSNGTVEKYPNGWYRVSAKVTTSSGNFSSSTRLDIQNTEHYVWGFQIEVGEFLTSFIPTNGSTATRGEDSAVIDGEDFDEFFSFIGAENNDYQGTLIASLESPAASNTSGRNNKIQVEQNNDNKVQLALVGGGTPYFDGLITRGTANQADFTGSQGSTFPTVIKHGVAYAKNNAAYSYNGNTVETDNNVTIGGVSTVSHGKYTQLTIGGRPSKAHIKRVMYYSQRISNTQLRNLTS